MENESILSDRARKKVEKVKELLEKAAEGLTKERKSVGAQIIEENSYLWEDIIDGCRRYKIKMSPDFMEFMCKCAIEVRNMYFPIAKASGLETIPFALERLKKQAEIMKNNKNWIEETDNLHNNIIKETDKTLIVQIKKK